MSDWSISIQSAQECLEHAEYALSYGNLPEAAVSLATALSTDPTRADWRTLLEQILRSAPTPASLQVPANEVTPPFVVESLRAYAEAYLGNVSEGIVRITEVAAACPERPYLVWARDWATWDWVQTSDPGTLSRLVYALRSMVMNCPIPCQRADPRYRNCEAATDILSFIYRILPHENDVLLTSAVALRCVGRFEDAIACAERAFESSPSWLNCMAVAGAYRDAQRPDRAAHHYRVADQLQPGDVTALIELGDMFLDAKRYDDAIGTYSEALQREPEHEWARASSAFARLEKAAAEGETRETLFEMTDTNPRARELVMRIAQDSSDQSAVFGQRLFELCMMSELAPMRAAQKMECRMAFGREVSVTRVAFDLEPNDLIESGLIMYAHSEAQDWVTLSMVPAAHLELMLQELEPLLLDAPHEIEVRALPTQDGALIETVDHLFRVPAGVLIVKVTPPPGVVDYEEALKQVYGRHWASFAGDITVADPVLSVIVTSELREGLERRPTLREFRDHIRR